jgi:IMP dehydrogenase
MNYAYSFDDVLLQPEYTDFVPAEADTKTKLTPSIYLKLPFVSAAMDSVTESAMAIKVAMLGGIGVIHKNMTVEQQCQEVAAVKNMQDIDKISASLDQHGKLQVLAAIGTHESDYARALKLIEAGVNAVVIDTSHGHSSNVYNIIKKLKSASKVEIIVGNIATKEAAKDLIALGVEALKVGIGPGSICTTRIISGVGVPQLSAIMAVSEACKGQNVSVIADGGIKYSGDIAKAIAAGADCTMMGSMFAGTDEAPGEIFESGGKKYKKYRGMGSVEAMKSGSADRYFQKEKSANLVSQGVVGTVPYKGAVEPIIRQLHGGLISAMGYTGNKNIAAMQKNCQFYLVTQSGAKEGHVHSLSSFEETQNYIKK